MSVVYVLTTPMPEDGGENPTMEQVRKRAKWDNDDYVCRGLILNGMSGSLFDVYQNVKTSKELWDTLEAKYMAEDALRGINSDSHLHIDESIRAQDNDKPKRNNVAGPSVVNMVEHNNSSRIAKLVMLATEPMDQAQRDQSMDDDVAWWVNSGATVHVCKDRCWFKTYESLNNGSILHMGNESTTLVHRRGYVDLRLTIVSDNIGSAFLSTFKLNDSILWHARLGHVHFKRMQDMSKDRLIPAFDMDTGKCQTWLLNKITKKLFQNVKRETEVLELIHSDLCDLHATPSLGNKKYFATFIDDASRFYYVYLLHSKGEALDKFKVFKTKVELQQGSLIKRFRPDSGGIYSYRYPGMEVQSIHPEVSKHPDSDSG
ncbi:zinc finger, CCHC-type containing protein [Tanacetum coccineum]